MRARAAIALLAMFPIATAAADEAEPVRIELKAHKGCPSEADAFAELQKQTKLVRAPAKGEKAKVFKITIKQVGEKSVGELVFPSADLPKRTVTADTCEEVVSELAYSAAISIDPEAGAKSDPVVEPAASPEAPPPLPAPKPTLPKPPEPPSKMRIALGGGVTAMGLASASWVVGAPVHVDVAFERRALLSPSFRAAFLHARGSVVETATGVAGFRWTLAQLDACPVRLVPTVGFALRPCAGLEAGALGGRGGRIAAPVSATRAWFAARAFARVTYWFGGVLALELDAGIALPFVRDAFRFDRTEELVYRAPAVAPFVTLGVQARLF